MTEQNMQKPKRLTQDFTAGNITKQMLVFASPLFLSNLLQAVYNMVDMIIVGQEVGKAGLSAVSIGGDVLHFLTFLAMGFSSAGQVIIAQHIGAGKEERLDKIVGNLFTILFSAAVVFSTLCFVLRQPILTVMNTPEESWSNAMAYCSTCILGMVFIYGYNVVSAILRGMGDSRHPFLFIAIAAVLNMILDLVFVVGLDMEAFGAALATVISQGASFLFGLVFILKHKEELNLHLNRNSFALDKEVVGDLMKLGVPMAIKSAAISVSMLFVNSWVNSYGVVPSGTSGVFHKLNTVSNLFCNATNAACSTMIGQNIGGEKYKRVPRILYTGYAINLSLVAVLALLLVLFPSAIFGIFTPDAEILEAAGQLVPILLLAFFASAIRSPSSGLIDGSGNYKLNFAVAFLDGILNRIGFSLLFGLVFDMGWKGFLLGDAVAGLTPFFIGYIYFLTGRWKTRKYLIR